MINATINLPTLRCHQQFDSGGASEPYLWTAFFFADFVTTKTSKKVRVIVPQFFNSLRSSFPDGVTNGQDISIPPEVGRQTIKLDASNDVVALGVLVLLLEQDDTREDAMKIGHRAFAEALEKELNKFVEEHGATRPNDEQVKAITSAVESSTKDAIKKELNLIDQLFRNQDDFLGVTFTLLIGKEVTNSNGSGLTFPLIEKDEFQVSGTRIVKVGRQKYEIVGAKLTVEPFVPDPCAAQVLAFNQATVEVDQLKKALRALEEQFKKAPALQKPIIREEIEEIRTVDLPAALEVVKRAQEQLTACRNSH
jgi:hypothetical protein